MISLSERSGRLKGVVKVMPEEGMGILSYEEIRSKTFSTREKRKRWERWSGDFDYMAFDELTYG